MTSTATWDRAAIVALGTAACALSYDALTQMATAIHVRGKLIYLFPLVLDGFIAYGVRALLILRTASLAARCYVWLMFGTATSASIWANALHAVRLNGPSTSGGLHLSDLTVGVLSTLAPLALAGAVHLYILIARLGVTAPGDNRNQTPHSTLRSTKPAEVGSDRSGLGNVQSAPWSAGRTKRTARRSRNGLRSAGRTGRPSRDAVDRAARSAGRTKRTAPKTKGEPDTVLGIAALATQRAGRISRRVVRTALADHGVSISNQALGDVLKALREDRGEAPKATRPDTGAF